MYYYYYFYIIVLLFNTFISTQPIIDKFYKCYTGTGVTLTTKLTGDNYCLFSPTCTTPIQNPPWVTNPLQLINSITSQPYVKNIVCSDTQFAGLPLVLTYQLTNTINNPFDPPKCSYQISFTDCQKTLSTTIDANIVWALTQLESIDLHSNVVQSSVNSKIGDLCSMITTGNAKFQCNLPYSKPNPQSTCSLMQSLNFNCHEHLMLCSNPQAANSATCTGVTYRCNTSEPLALDADCSNVDLTTIRGLLADSNTTNSLYPTCTTLRNTYCKSTAVNTNKFNCFRPWSETTNGSFCQRSQNFASVQPRCGSNAHYSGIFAYSDNGPTGTHTVLYPLFVDFLNSQVSTPVIDSLAKPQLSITCTVLSTNSGIFAPLYAAANDLITTVFPPMTLPRYVQLFCQTTFQQCPLWQLDGLSLICNSTLRQELGITTRRLLNFLDEFSNTENTLDNYLFTYIDPLYINTMLQSWNNNNLNSGNQSDPVATGNSACYNDPQCYKLLNQKFNPTILTMHMNLL